MRRYADLYKKNMERKSYLRKIILLNFKIDYFLGILTLDFKLLSVLYKNHIKGG